MKAGLPVSVIMSVYNGAAYLGQAVDSILGQTFADFEFVIVDDGSTDATADILEEYTRRDSRVRVFHQAYAINDQFRKLYIWISTRKKLSF